MNEFAWALIALMDGVKQHELQNMTGLPEVVCDRIWNAYVSALKIEAENNLENFVNSQVEMDPVVKDCLYENRWELYDR